MGGLLSGGGGGGGGGKAKVAKVSARRVSIDSSTDWMQADWSEGLRKKKQAGVGDMTLLSTITNDAINDNLKARFHNQEIYVGSALRKQQLAAADYVDIHRSCAHLGQPFQRSAVPF